MTKKQIADQALRRYKHCVESNESQLKNERQDLEFQVPDRQWDEGAKRARSGADGTPPRPMLSISKLDQPKQILVNQMRQARLGVNIHPLGLGANDKTAEVLAGLYRKIERDSRANLAREWAFERAVIAGRGVYRINTVYDDSGDHPFDQRITIERILYQETVLFDPSAQEPDFSDGNFAFISSWVPWDTFKRLYPNADPSEVDSTGLEQIDRVVPEWVRMGERPAIKVTEYFCKEYETNTIYLLSNGMTVDDKKKLTGFNKELEKLNKVGAKRGLPPKPLLTIVNERENTSYKLMYYKFCPGRHGLQELECVQWNGQYIPLIPVLGNEIVPFDEKRLWFGMNRRARDAQKLYNFEATNALELTSQELKAPYLLAAGQIRGYETDWNQANVKNLAYLYYHQTDSQGKDAPRPQREHLDMGRLGPTMQLLHAANDFIQATTSTPDAVLGRFSGSDNSGKAIESLQNQSQASTSNYLQNLADISMPLEARCILSMIPNIYDRPGRVVEIMSEEGDSSYAMLNHPSMIPPNGPKNARPVPVDPNQQPDHLNYDLTKGVYGVNVVIGKTQQSLREEGANELGQIMKGMPPEMMMLVLPTYMAMLDFPGQDKVTAMLKKFLFMKYPEIATQEGEKPSPEQLEAQLVMATKKIEEMNKALAQAKQDVETEQARQQAVIQKAQIESESKLRQQEMITGSKMDHAHVNALVTAATEKMRAENEEKLQKETQRFEMVKQAMEHKFEVVMKGIEQRFQAVQNALDRQTQKDLKTAADEATEKADESTIEENPDGGANS